MVGLGKKREKDNVKSIADYCIDRVRSGYIWGRIRTRWDCPRPRLVGWINPGGLMLPLLLLNRKKDTGEGEGSVPDNAIIDDDSIVLVDDSGEVLTED